MATTGNTRPRTRSPYELEKGRIMRALGLQFRPNTYRLLYNYLEKALKDLDIPQSGANMTAEPPYKKDARDRWLLSHLTHDTADHFGLSKPAWVTEEKYWDAWDGVVFQIRKNARRARLAGMSSEYS